MNLNRQQVAPLKVARSNRVQQTRALTSLPAGKVVPLAAIPMLREDSMRGRYRVSFELHETVEILMNAVNVRVCAYLVPFLALPRFQGSMDQFNRSYRGQPQIDGGSSVAFFPTKVAEAFGVDLIAKYLGMHAKAGDTVNEAYVQAYNLIWNYRAKNRSKEITPRSVTLATSLAPAFWQHDQFAHILPDFDQAVIDGEVALNVTNGQLSLTGSAPVRGIGILDSGVTASSAGPFQDATGGGLSWSHYYRSSTAEHYFKASGANGNILADVDLSAVFAELDANGISVSLSNLELARKTQAFAKLREQYEGHAEDWLISLLMDGISIPDQALKDPMLISEQSAVFGQAKRYASDAANLTDSVVNGAAAVEFEVNVPRLTTGGIVMITAEVTPEQLFERQRDPLFYTTDVATLPEYLRDTLDPEKVDVVLNGRMDVQHSTPANVFGYEPLNAKWQNVQPRIGGRFFRPTDTSADEARQRIWAVEVANPVLSQDFYIATTMNQKPVFITTIDPVEAVTLGQAVINGNTVFGGVLAEDTGNYDDVLAEADQTRIDQTNDPTNP